MGTLNTFVLTGGKRQPLEMLEEQISSAFPDLRFRLMSFDGVDDPMDLPEADAGICTLWTTAFLLVRYNRCRAKFYFNQDFEPSFFSAGSQSALIEQTYRFGFVGICNSRGVADKFKEYERWVRCFDPGVCANTFYPDLQRKDDPVQIVFYGRPTNSRNAFRLGIEVLRAVKRLSTRPVRIISVGAEFDPAEFGLEDVLECRGVLGSIEEVAELYRQSHIGLVFMFTPHPSYQPLEYMASGCATVTNMNERNTWLLRDRENCRMVVPTLTVLVAAVIELIENDQLRTNIMTSGLKTVSRLTWDQPLADITEFLCHPNILPLDPNSAL